MGPGCLNLEPRDADEAPVVENVKRAFTLDPAGPLVAQQTWPSTKLTTNIVADTKTSSTETTTENVMARGVKMNFTAAANGLLITSGDSVQYLWDITNPSTPIMKGRLTSKYDANTVRTGSDPLGCTVASGNNPEAEGHQLAIARYPGTNATDPADDKLYLATISGRGVDIWDISDAHNWSYKTVGGYNVAPNGVEYRKSVVIGSTCYGDVDNGVWGIAWQGDKIYVGATNQGVYLISDPLGTATVTQIATSAEAGIKAGPLFALGPTLLVTTPKDSAGISVMSIANAADAVPGPAGSLVTVAGENMYFGGFYNKHAYLMGNLRAWDISGGTAVSAGSAYNPQVAANGLMGDYYTGTAFNTYKASRIDGTVNYTWATGVAPDVLPGFPNDGFSIRWTGKVKTTSTAGTYQFCTYSDDGAKLWVNNVLLVDKWIGQGPTEWCGSTSLSASTMYDIKFEYYDGSSGAQATLRWTPPGGSKVTIPKANLFYSTQTQTRTEYVAFGDGVDDNGTEGDQYLYAGSTRTSIAPGNTSPGNGMTGWLKYKMTGPLSFSFIRHIPNFDYFATNQGTDDQFGGPVGNLLVLCDDEKQETPGYPPRGGCWLTPHQTQMDTQGPKLLWFKAESGVTRPRITFSFNEPIDIASVHNLVVKIRRVGTTESWPGRYAVEKTVLTWEPFGDYTSYGGTWGTTASGATTAFEVKIVEPASTNGNVKDLVGNKFNQAGANNNGTANADGSWLSTQFQVRKP